jgi:membrane protein YqaA with SNARE-associated domain
MNLDKLPLWLRAAVASSGGLGVFLVAFLDSSFLTFPVINDLLVISLSMENPVRMPYYALMATLGSVIGCVLLFFVARKGGEVAFRKHAGERADRIHVWVARNGFLSVLVAALLPPPAPFKLFVLAAGVFRVPLRSFALAVLVARAFRYLGIGFLAVQYGAGATRFVAEHKLEVGLVILVLILASYLVSRRAFRSSPAER